MSVWVSNDITLIWGLILPVQWGINQAQARARQLANGLALRTRTQKRKTATMVASCTRLQVSRFTTRNQSVNARARPSAWQPDTDSPRDSHQTLGNLTTSQQQWPKGLAISRGSSLKEWLDNPSWATWTNSAWLAWENRPQKVLSPSGSIRCKAIARMLKPALIVWVCAHHHPVPTTTMTIVIRAMLRTEPLWLCELFHWTINNQATRWDKSDPALSMGRFADSPLCLTDWREVTDLTPFQVEPDNQIQFLAD